MRNAYLFHRLRKYRRKKFKASDPQALRYWKYWHRLYGGHVNLWNRGDN